MTNPALNYILIERNHDPLCSGPLILPTDGEFYHTIKIALRRAVANGDKDLTYLGLIQFNELTGACETVYWGQSMEDAIESQRNKDQDDSDAADERRETLGDLRYDQRHSELGGF